MGAPYNSPHVSDKALRDYAYRVLMSERHTINAKSIELQYFVEQLTPDQLTEIYMMFYKTEMVG